MKHSASNTANTTKPRLRWFQFRLRTLMLLILLAAIGLKIQMTGARQRKAVAAIRHLTGSILYDYQCDPNGRERRRIPSSLPQTWLRSLLGPDFSHRVVSVHFRRSRQPEIGDADLMPYLGQLKDLRVVSLRKTNITNEGLRHLRDHKHLHSLYLESTKINEGNLDQLKGLRLDWLCLSRTRASDMGLKSLQDMISLRYLDLTRTKVTDAGLQYIKGLRNLTALNLRRTEVSRRGAERLQKDLPNCTVYWEPLMARASNAWRPVVPEGFRSVAVKLPMYRDNAQFSLGDHVDVLRSTSDTPGGEIILKNVLVHSVMLACGSFEVNLLDKARIHVWLLVAPDDADVLMAARQKAAEDGQKLLLLRHTSNDPDSTRDN